MTTFRDIARDEIARLEHHYRTQSRALWLTVEADHVEILTHGPDVPEGATPGDRAEALASALDRVHEGKTRAVGLRRVGRVLRLVLRAMGGEPIYDRDAVPETVRQARIGLAHDEQEVSYVEREPVRLDRSEVEGAAERHGLMTEDATNGQ